ncbi:odorant receptor 13a-like [Vespa mandarinia]|uniref:odorant receptor 13a-like n=1 Tax=Vespa mandarinia TaxID=7446 RepID=UPI001611436C|nr:odorant receptor 13a-like [Vespa mandarinia]
MKVMDFFDGRHYAINKSMLSLLGQWPYQSIRTKYIRLEIIFLLLGTQMLAKIAATITSFRDRSVVLDDMAPLVADSIAAIKLINVTVQKEKMKILLNRMQTDYALFATDGEMKIMVEYAENGRKFTIVYIGVFFVSMLQFMIPPLKSIILSNMNGSSERPLIHHVEYFVDSQRYYYLIILHSYAVIFICVFTIATMDTMFVVFVQHACGLFTAIGYQLRHIIDNNILLINLNPSKSNDKFYINISKCIHRHQEAIQFANLLDKYYSTSFFLVSGISMIGMSITGLQAILNINEPKQFFQQMCVCYTTLIHVLFECVNGQRLIDHSSQMHEYLINTEWYRTSLRTRKGICFMLLRSQKSCTITAAKMFNISIETFTSIVRTSISYFTVLRSIQ